MKTILTFIVIVLATTSSTPIFAEEADATKALSVTIKGIVNYNEYKTLLNDIKKIEGVINLVPSREKAGSVALAGVIAKESPSVKNDLEALVVDRYKFTSKDSKDSLLITLEKL